MQIVTLCPDLATFFFLNMKKGNTVYCVLNSTSFECVYVILHRGRLLHGRHFTFKSINGDTAITFVSTGVEGAFATEEHPYAAHGPWLQVHTQTDTHNFLCATFIFNVFI